MRQTDLATRRIIGRVDAESTDSPFPAVRHREGFTPGFERPRGCCSDTQRHIANETLPATEHPEKYWRMQSDVNPGTNSGAEPGSPPAW